MSFLYNSYLFQSDYLYRHKIINFNNIPIIESLVIRFDLSLFNKELGEQLKNSSIIDTQLIGFLMFYLKTNSRPFIYLSNPKNFAYSLKRISLGKNANKFVYNNFTDFYSYFLSQLLFKTKNTKNIYYFRNSLINIASLKYFLKELFNISILKKINFVFNIILR
jgi:hypothetical protein